MACCHVELELEAKMTQNMSESTLPSLNDIYDKEINLADGGLVRIEL